LSGLYTNEEMGQARNEQPTVPSSRPQKVYKTPPQTVTPTEQPTPEPQEPKAPEIIDVEPEPAPEPVEPKPEKKAPVKRKEKTIPELIAGIPVALRHRKPDFDDELFPFCEEIVLDHFGVKTAEEIPGEKRDAVLNFLKNDLITYLQERGEL